MKAARIIDYGSTAEAQLIRAILENLGLRVTSENVGNPTQFLASLLDDVAGDFLLITGHGKRDGLWFGEYAPFVETDMLDSGYLGAEHLRPNAKGCCVIMTACETGNRMFSEPFRKAGARAFLAPRSEPEGVSVPLLLHHLFYQHLHLKQPLQDSLKVAHECVGKDNHFELFEFDRKDNQ